MWVGVEGGRWAEDRRGAEVSGRSRVRALPTPEGIVMGLRRGRRHVARPTLPSLREVVVLSSPLPAGEWKNEEGSERRPRGRKAKPPQAERKTAVLLNSPGH